MGAQTFALADASAVMSLESLKLPFTALLAHVMFARAPGIWTWLGARLLLASTIHIIDLDASATRVRANARAVRVELSTPPPAPSGV